MTYFLSSLEIPCNPRLKPACLHVGGRRPRTPRKVHHRYLQLEVCVCAYVYVVASSNPQSTQSIQSTPRHSRLIHSRSASSFQAFPTSRAPTFHFPSPPHALTLLLTCPPPSPRTSRDGFRERELRPAYYSTTCQLNYLHLRYIPISYVPRCLRYERTYPWTTFLKYNFS